MKKWWIPAILLLSLLLLISGGIVAAQEPTPTPSLIKIERIEGSITSIDLQAKKITIAPKQGPSITLNVTDDTEIEVWGKKPASLRDLKAGQSVEVTYIPAAMQAIEIEAKRLAEPPRGIRQGFFGKITSIAASSFTLDTRQAAVTFTITANTEFWNPPSKDAALKDLKVGLRVAVLAERADTTLLAKRVLVIPPMPVHEHIQGVVTGISGRDITITYNADKSVTAEAPPGKIRKIELGDLVTATIIRTPGVEKVIIKDIKGMDKLLDRLLRHAEKKKGRDREDIERLIKKNQGKHLEVLQRVLAKAPAAAKPGLMNAIEKSKAKGKAGVPPGKAPGGPQGKAKKTSGKP